MIPWLPSVSGRSNPYEKVFVPSSTSQKVFLYWPSGSVFIGPKFPKF